MGSNTSRYKGPGLWQRGHWIILWDSAGISGSEEAPMVRRPAGTSGGPFADRAPRSGIHDSGFSGP